MHIKDKSIENLNSFLFACHGSDSPETMSLRVRYVINNYSLYLQWSKLSPGCLNLRIPFLP